MGRIALRNLWERKLRTTLTALAIVLGVMMVGATYVLTDTIDRSFEDIFTQSNEGVDAVVTKREVIEADDGQVPPFSEGILRMVVRTGSETAAKDAGDIEEGFSFLTTALLVFAGIAVFVGAFLIFNTFSITVAQRTREFAMLRTLGAKRRQILGSVVTEAFVTGLLAGLRLDRAR